MILLSGVATSSVRIPLLSMPYVQPTVLYSTFFHDLGSQGSFFRISLIHKSNRAAQAVREQRGDSWNIILRKHISVSFISNPAMATFGRVSRTVRRTAAVGLGVTGMSFFGSDRKAASSASASSSSSSSLFGYEEDENLRTDIKEQYKGLSTRDSSSYLRRNFVAEAADIVSSAVVNIVIEVNTGWVVGVSSGSGFFYSKDGFIVTNAHVVAPSTDGKVLVTMWNGRKRRGIVHSMDKLSDIALIKLTDVGFDEDLPVAVMGTSGKLHIGEFVVALGSPLQLQNSITFGIVSATARHGSELGMAQNRTEFIQTDAAINVGNSGGPLVNLDGEVVGINSMKVRDSDGVSFAIPIDTAQQVIKQLIANKRVIRPYVGLRMINFAASNNRKLKSRDKNGMFTAEEIQVLVVDVESGSPAHRAGLQSGDLIVKVDGKKVKGVRDVLDAIGLDVGRTIEFGVRRQNGEEATCKVTLASEHDRIR